MVRHRMCAAAAGLLLAGAVSASPGASPGAAAPVPVRVLYAGSLVRLFEQGLAPAFARETGLTAEGRPGGSVALAHLIRDGLQRADVFISADPDVNRVLAPSGPRASAPWFLTLARTTMVIAYNPQSRFAPEFSEAAAGRRAWYEVLASPGVRVGRTDPLLDPKGYRTLLLLRLAERHYGRPGLEAAILGTAENPAQIFPEEELVGRLEAGQLDAGFFYLIEALEQHLPSVALPDAVNLGSPALAAAYTQVSYTDPSGAVRRGGPILYTATIPPAAQNVAGAIRFIQFLYGPGGRTLLEAHGLLAVHVLAGGDPRGVPPPLRHLIEGQYGG